MSRFEGSWSGLISDMGRIVPLPKPGGNENLGSRASWIRGRIADGGEAEQPEPSIAVASMPAARVRDDRLASDRSLLKNPNPE